LPQTSAETLERRDAERPETVLERAAGVVLAEVDVYRLGIAGLDERV
jgi:hypothetical protein